VYIRACSQLLQQRNLLHTEVPWPLLLLLL
jgi:hypothetical protein